MSKIQHTPILSAKKSDIEMMLVDPDQASAWLENGEFSNRKVSDNLVAKIANDISNNQWRFDGNGIKFDKEGNLIDGQHRLWAIMKAQRSVMCMVVRNLEHSAINVIDTGKSRSSSDILHFNGFINNNALANACRLLLGFKEYGGDLHAWAIHRKNHVYSASDFVKEADNNKELITSINKVGSFKFTKKYMGHGTSALCHYIFTLRDKMLADEFFNLLENGIGLPEGHAVLALRNSLTLRNHVGNHSFKGGYYRAAYLVALTIKAWNAFSENRLIKRLTYGEEKEKFPVAI